MRSRFEGLNFTCTHCRVTSPVAPPFNLSYFACAQCGVVSHPFVEQDGQTLDLRYLRELLVACYHDESIASGVLIQSARRGRRGRPWDAQVKLTVVVAHALLAYAHHRRIHISGMSIIGGIFVPFLHMLSHYYARGEQKEELRKWTKVGPLSPTAFDPRRPFAPDALNRAQLHPVFWSDLSVQPPDTRVYYVDHWTRYLDGIGEPASIWNISIDRACSIDDARPKPIPVVDAEFAKQVAERATLALSRDSTFTCRPQRVILCRSDLSGPPFLQKELLDTDSYPKPTWTHEQSRAILDSHVVRTLEVHSLQTIQSCDHRTGIVYNTCISVSSLASLTSVRWRLYCWGPSDAGIRNVHGHLDKSEREMCSAEIKSNKLGFGIVFDALPAIAYIIVLIMLMLANESRVTIYVFLCLVSFAHVLVFSGQRVDRRRDPLPRELQSDKWQDRMAEAVIEASWRQFDRSPTRGVTGTFGPASIHHGVLADEIDFALHTHNEILLTAIIEEAESRGINMKEFKDHVFELNNFGVIASEIHGPVATGSRAQATTSTLSTRRERHAKQKNRK
jgi:hypothetical protein